MKRWIIGFLFLSFASFIFVNVIVSNANDRMCVDGGYYVLEVTDTFHTINKKESHIIQGFVTKIITKQNFIIGYLTLKYAQENDLTGLLGSLDKEGYFLINTKTNSLDVGLSENKILELTKSNGISMIIEKDLHEPVFDSSSCSKN